MISAYSIAAVFFMIIAVGAMYRNLTFRSPFYLDIFGKKYARESKTITGIFDRLEWGAGGGYWMVCRVGESGTEVKFPHTRAVSGETSGQEIPLILVKDIGFDVYIPQNHRNEKSFADCVVLEPDGIAQQNKKTQAVFATGVAGCCIGFVCLQSIPVFSCILFLASTAAFILSRPLLDWKKCEECCKINIKEVQKAKATEVDLKKNAFPPDYDHWSQTKKDLYGITVRLESEQMAGKEDAELDSDTPPADGWVNIEQPDIDNPGYPEEPSVYEGIVPKACKNCGCIVDNDAFFCPNCGAQQKKVPDFPKEWEGFEEFEDKQKNVVNDATPTDVTSKETENADKTENDTDDAASKEQRENLHKSNSSRRGKKSRNRRYRPDTNSGETDVDKMIRSLESPAQFTL